MEILPNTFAHFTEQRKAEVWQIAIRTNSRFYLWIRQFSPMFYFFLIAAYEFCGQEIFRNWEYLPPSYQQYLQFSKAEIVVSLLYSWFVPEGKSRLDHVEVDEQQNRSLTLNL